MLDLSNDVVMSIFSGENLFSAQCAGAEAAVVQQCTATYYAIVLPSKKTAVVAIRIGAGDLLLWVLHKQNAYALAAAAKASQYC